MDLRKALRGAEHLRWAGIDTCMQDSPESYALQRTPQAPMQLSFVEALKNKDVISAAEGARLGVATGAILDASAMTLEAITLSDTVAPTARGEPPFCVPTATLTQARLPSPQLTSSRIRTARAPRAPHGLRRCPATSAAA